MIPQSFPGYLIFSLPLCFLHRSRLLLGSSVVLTIFFSLIASFGIAAYAGVTLTVLSPLVVFILLGVGVDDMIIIVDSYKMTEHHATSIEDRMVRSSIL